MLNPTLQSKQSVLSDHLFIGHDVLLRLIKTFHDPQLLQGTTLLWASSNYPFLDDRNKVKLIREVAAKTWPFSDCKPLYETFVRYEEFLRAINKREHIIHQFEVFLLGWQLIHASYAKEKFNGLAIQDTLRTWLITSLFHDVGYFLEKANDILGFFNETYSNLQLEPLASKFSEFHSSIAPAGKTSLFSTSIQKTYPKSIEHIRAILLKSFAKDAFILDTFFGDMIEGCDHGLVSAILLLDSVKSIDLSVMDNQNKIDLACSAIALHNSHNYSDRANPKQIITHVDVSQSPFSVILFIIDNIQDWSRDNEIAKPNTTFLLTSVQTGPKSVNIDILVRADFWTAELVDSTKKQIKFKRDILMAVPQGAFGLTVTIKYSCIEHALDDLITLSI